MSGNVLQFREIGDPILREVCKEVKGPSARVKRVIADLKATSLYDGELAGLAAPQIGYSDRIIIIGISQESCARRGIEYLPPTIMINPVITDRSEETATEYEACCSVPCYVGLVSRPLSLTVSFLDENFTPQEWKVSGYLARIIQHEEDHLNGDLYTDIADPRYLTTLDNLNRF